MAALLSCLADRGSKRGPFFKVTDGQPLTMQRLVDSARKALREPAGLDDTCGHSFQIGAATAAEEHGIEDSMIKTLGRWRSLAYLDYIKIPRGQLAGYSWILAT